MQLPDEVEGTGEEHVTRVPLKLQQPVLDVLSQLLALKVAQDVAQVEALDIGCKVLDEKGQELGVVKEVEEFPAQLTLRVKRAGKEDFFVPFVKAFIRRVDINKKEIEINVIGGML